ncbi:uncharacterized protein SAPINGB_P002021 [Magnusiomyces paraingens]|uniref:Uncharacterized protein n=1 Tax=Magnusiomyces paraingens TaxID=2606893 RepID=A0A5E8BHE2_9ASCO|nr:uncharacterized protein SAPINGB_P002021 [Saprochaete ingens]VVT48931.1 unnamed protein product [Saprochaete ingens]
MVGPRGNSSPYNKRIGNVGRVVKQSYGYPSMSSQQHAAIATSYQNQVQQQPSSNNSPHPHSDAAASSTGGKYGDDIEELGGSRDFIDVVSFRDTAMVRYIRYHEWMELILGTAVDTKQYVNGAKSTTDIEARAKSTYLDKVSRDDESIFEKTEETRKAKTAFFRKATDTLKDEFGSLSTVTLGDKKRTTTEKSLEKELREDYGIVIVENARVRPVRADMDIPETLTKESVEAKYSDATSKSSENPSNSGEIANESSAIAASVPLSDIPTTLPLDPSQQDISENVPENIPTSVTTVTESVNSGTIPASNILLPSKDTIIPPASGTEPSLSSAIDTNSASLESNLTKNDTENIPQPKLNEVGEAASNITNEPPNSTDTEMPDVITNP